MGGLRRLGVRGKQVLHAADVGHIAAAASDAAAVGVVVVQGRIGAAQAGAALRQAAHKGRVQMVQALLEVKALPYFSAVELVHQIVADLVAEHGFRQLLPPVGHGAAQGDGAHLLVRAVVDHLALGDIRRGIPQQGVQRLVHIGLQPVVGVHKADERTGGGVQPRVAGGEGALIGLVYHMHPPVAGSVVIADGGRTVGRAIVHQPDLQIGIQLAQQAVDTAAQAALRLVDRYDNAEQRLICHGCSPL